MARKKRPNTKAGPGFRISRSKYRAKPTEYGGIRYASKAEAAWAESLDGDIKVGLVDYVVRQPRFTLGSASLVYSADFHVILANDWASRPDIPEDLAVIFEATRQRSFIDEVKGFETPKFKQDKKLWMEFGPCAMRIIKRGKVDEILIPDKFHEDAERGQ